jgi:hypothetical protein
MLYINGDFAMLIIIWLISLINWFHLTEENVVLVAKESNTNVSKGQPVL